MAEPPEFPDIPTDLPPAGEESLEEGPMFDENAIPDDHKSGYVALVGKPNVGKSTLMNQLVGRKLSIVTRKPQTTRHRVLGILSDDDYQIILLDTPGFIDPRYGLQKAMMHAARGAVHEADLVVFMAEATLDRPDDISLHEVDNQPAILAINKIDLVSDETIPRIVDIYTERRAFDEVVPISAKTGENVDVLHEKLIELLPFGPPFYPKDVISEHPERFFVAEIIREKIFDQYRQEIPYSTQVNIVEFKERDRGKDFIDAEIVVERSSQKGILIGKGGKALKNVGKAARRDVETFLDRPVYLQLHVKVREDWRDRQIYLQSYGYNR
jgi:GTP-binding protein Era